MPPCIRIEQKVIIVCGYGNNLKTNDYNKENTKRKRTQKRRKSKPRGLCLDFLQLWKKTILGVTIFDNDGL